MGCEERREDPRTDRWTMDAFRIGDNRFQSVPYEALGPRCEFPTVDQRREHFYVHKTLPELATTSRIQRRQHGPTYRRFGLLCMPPDEAVITENRKSAPVVFLTCLLNCTKASRTHGIFAHTMLAHSLNCVVAPSYLFQDVQPRRL